jgi:ribonucleoside-diphosphate reductase alpha chain
MLIEKRKRWSPHAGNVKLTYEELDLLKIVNRIKYLAVGHDNLGGEDVNPKFNKKDGREIIKIGRPLTKIKIQELAMQVIKFISDGTKSSEIDNYTIKCCLEKILESSEYEELAARIYISAMHKETPCKLSDSMKYGFFKTTKNGDHAPRIREEILLFVMNNETELEHMIDYTRDFNLSYFGIVTLTRPGGISYLNKDQDGNLVERPQHLFMREAIEFYFDNADSINKIKETYDILSLKYATHATPTMSNACSEYPRLVSCNLMCVRDDSIAGIGESIRDMMLLSKNEAGVGIYTSNIRAAGSIIKTTGGESKGSCSFYKIFEKVFETIDQGGKRKGSAALYVDVWHADFPSIIEMPRNTHAADENRARSLFYGAVVNDLFMKTAEYECDKCLGPGKCPGLHYFMSPDICPELIDTFGDEYEKVYKEYIAEGKYIKYTHAREVLYEMIFTMINSGKLYVFNRDAANRSNNLENVGMINCSNLCTEITLPVRLLTGDKTDIISVCNLASIKLDSFICHKKNNSLELNVHDFNGNDISMYFDIVMFEKVVKNITRNLDIVIDRTSYPENKTRKTNLSMRPIGIGVQGMADLFIKYGLPYESKKAKLLNWYLFNCLYLFALEATIEMAAEKGAYQYFNGSPASKGILQGDFQQNNNSDMMSDLSALLNNPIDFHHKYDKLRGKPMRNSLLVAPMPTASTAQILDSYESFEPPTSNIFTRQTLAGTFTIINKYLFKELEARNLWNSQVVDTIINDNGSVKNLKISEYAKLIYKTVWEISMKRYIDLSADRAQFICQSQSLNLYWTGTADEIKNKIFSALMHGWKKGLKTLCYYTRIQSQTGQKIENSEIAFKEQLAKDKAKVIAGIEGECLSCGS